MSEIDPRGGISIFQISLKFNDAVQTVQTVQYRDSQCTQQQYRHERGRCSWLHAGLFCIAQQPFTQFVFHFFTPVVYMQPWLNQGIDIHIFNFFRTPSMGYELPLYHKTFQ